MNLFRIRPYCFVMSILNGIVKRSLVTNDGTHTRYHHQFTIVKNGAVQFVCKTKSSFSILLPLDQKIYLECTCSNTSSKFVLFLQRWTFSQGSSFGKPFVSNYLLFSSPLPNKNCRRLCIKALLFYFVVRSLVFAAPYVDTKVSAKVPGTEIFQYVKNSCFFV